MCPRAEIADTQHRDTMVLTSSCSTQSTLLFDMPGNDVTFWEASLHLLHENKLI